MVQESGAISRVCRSFAALNTSMMIVTGSFRNFAEAASKFQKQQVELEMAARNVRHLVDADGYVKLGALLETAQQFGDPQTFINAVGTCVVSPYKCQCWWCRLKRWTRQATGNMMIKLQRGEGG